MTKLTKNQPLDLLVVMMNMPRIEIVYPFPHRNQIQILSAGYNGALPNMDMIAATIAQGPPHTIINSPSTVQYPLHKSTTSDILINEKLKQKKNVPENHILKNNVDNPSSYSSRLSGLWRFAGSLISGPDGFHAHFLAKNIDAITIRFLLSSEHSPTSTTPTNSNNRNRNKYKVENKKSNKIRDLEDDQLIDKKVALLFLHNVLRSVSTLHGTVNITINK